MYSILSSKGITLFRKKTRKMNHSKINLAELEATELKQLNNAELATLSEIMYSAFGKRKIMLLIENLYVYLELDRRAKYQQLDNEES